MKCCGVKDESDFSLTKQNWKQTIQGRQQIHPIGCCKLKKSFDFDSKSKCIEII